MPTFSFKSWVTLNKSLRPSDCLVIYQTEVKTQHSLFWGKNTLQWSIWKTRELRFLLLDSWQWQGTIRRDPRFLLPQLLWASSTVLVFCKGNEALPAETPRGRLPSSASALPLLMGNSRLTLRSACMGWLCSPFAGDRLLLLKLRVQYFENRHPFLEDKTTE